MIFQVFYLIFTAATAIVLGVLAFQHVESEVLALLSLPTLVSGALLSVGYLLGWAREWARSKRSGRRREGQASGKAAAGTSLGQRGASS